MAVPFKSNCSGLRYFFEVGHLNVFPTTIPWVSNFLNGSQFKLAFVPEPYLESRNFAINLANSKCKIACSIPPMYMSTGSSFFFGSQYLDDKTIDAWLTFQYWLDHRIAKSTTRNQQRYPLCQFPFLHQFDDI